MYLRKKRRQRISSADRVAGSIEKAIPLLVVDRSAWTDLATQDLDRNLSQPLSLQSRIEILQPQLTVTTEKRCKLAEEMLIA